MDRDEEQQQDSLRSALELKPHFVAVINKHQHRTLHTFCKMYLACLTWERSISRFARRVVCCCEGIPLFAITHIKASVTTLSRWCSFLLLSGSSPDKGNTPKQRDKYRHEEEKEATTVDFFSDIIFQQDWRRYISCHLPLKTVQIMLHVPHEASAYTPLPKFDGHILCKLSNSPKSSHDNTMNTDVPSVLQGFFPFESLCTLYFSNYYELQHYACSNLFLLKKPSFVWVYPKEGGEHGERHCS